MSYPDLNTLCRLCLKEGDGTINIFESREDLPTEKQISVPMRIMACVALEVHAGDALPKVICRACRYQLEKTFVFRKRAQLSDSKLRKHIRLLNVGKPSNVFLKSYDDDEEEFELEDSLEFLKQEERVQETEQENLLNNMRLEHEKELEKLKISGAEKYAKELKEMRKNIFAETKEKIRSEIEMNLRYKLREECMARAKEELRAELKEECQQIEKENLLKDLESFLNERQHNTSATERKADKESPQSSMSKNKIKGYKRIQSPDAAERKLQCRRKENLSTDHIDMDENEQIVHQTFEVVTKEVEKLDEVENRNEENYIIVDTDSNNDKAEFLENNDEVHYEGSEEDEQYTISTDNNNAELEVYEIKEDGEIETLDKEDQGVVYLNMSEVAETEDMDILEFVDIKEKNKGTTFFASATSNDVTNICGYTKLSRNNDKDSNEQDAKDVVLYGTSTDTPKTFKCKLCPIVFSTKNSLHRHYKTHERLEKKGVEFKCPECHVIFSCRSALNRHQVIHTGARPYKCEECGKSFVQREILKRHQKTHTGERPFKCSHCPRAYTQKVNLQEHLKHNHSKGPKLAAHVCHLCPKRFNHASGLSRHLTTHSGITYQCIRCERRFGDRSSVKRHVLNVHLVSEKHPDAAKFIKECNNQLEIE